jgi:hypothetical protein
VGQLIWDFGFGINAVLIVLATSDNAVPQREESEKNPLCLVFRGRPGLGERIVVPEADIDEQA